MEVRVIQGIENEFEMLEIRASTKGEADLLKRFIDEGTRVASRGHWSATICSPALSNQKVIYLNPNQRKLIYDALVDVHIEDVDLSRLLTELVGAD